MLRKLLVTAKIWTPSSFYLVIFITHAIRIMQQRGRSQRPRVAEPEATFLSSSKLRALRRLTHPSALQLFLLHCYWPRQSCLSHAKASDSFWHRFFSSHSQTLLDFAFPSFHLEDIFRYSHSEDGKASRLSCFLPANLSHLPPAYQSFLNASFYLVYFCSWNLIPYSFPARPVSGGGGGGLLRWRPHKELCFD